MEEIYVLHEREDWVQDVSDEHGSITALPNVFRFLVHIFLFKHLASFRDLVVESIRLIKEAVLAIDNREDDILDHATARSGIIAAVEDRG